MLIVQDIRATWSFKFNHYFIYFFFSVCRKLDKGIKKRNGEGLVLTLNATDLRIKDSELGTSSIS